MILERTCPCGGNHFAIGALYSNGLDCFTLFWLPANCPDARRAERQLRLRQQPEGITASMRLPDGTALVLVGELQPQHAAQMLTD
jgi:negative regulator of sigma E activity